MKKTKILFLLLIFFICNTTITLYGCNNKINNYSEDDQKVAEKDAINKLVVRETLPYSVVETIYDAETNKYIILLTRTTVLSVGDQEVYVPIGDDEDDIRRLFINEVTDGRISYSARGNDSWDSGWSADFTPDKVIVTGPNNQVYEFLASQK